MIEREHEHEHLAAENPATPVPVITVPIPARASRTLRLARIMSWLGGILALLPELLSDPLVIAFINKRMSQDARIILGIVVFGAGLYLRSLRRDTSAPIAGTPAASSLPPADLPSSPPSPPPL